jgi:muramoyltetrapeptide carboxypeptidase
MAKRDLPKANALQAGQRVRLIAPASPFDPVAFEAGIATLRSLDLIPVFDRAEFQRTGFLAGSDASRAERLSRALLEKESDAVWCIRGGYGAARLLPFLDLGRLCRRPKLLIGFSDVTALLLRLSFFGGFTTIHGPVITQLAHVPREALRWLTRMLRSQEPLGVVPWGKLRCVRPGRAQGRILAANLSILSSLVGTPYLPSMKDVLLCVEDVGEEAYRLDRMFQQCLQSGLFKGVRGVVLGSLENCKPTGRSFFSAQKVLERAAISLCVPVVSGAWFGHNSKNFALPQGVRARLDASAGKLELLEAAVQ